MYDTRATGVVFCISDPPALWKFECEDLGAPQAPYVTRGLSVLDRILLYVSSSRHLSSHLSRSSLTLSFPSASNTAALRSMLRPRLTLAFFLLGIGFTICTICTIHDNNCTEIYLNIYSKLKVSLHNNHSTNIITQHIRTV